MSDDRAADPDSGLTRRDALLRVLGVLVASGMLSAPDAGAGPVTIDQFGDQLQTLPRRGLPDFARSRGPSVGEVYRFALEHGADLEYIPCFCGCKNIGHRHNRDCYIKGENRDGTVTYTSHGAT